MRTKDLDILKPEGYTITFQGKEWSLAALTTEQVIEIWPRLKEFRELARNTAALREKGPAELLGDEDFVKMLEVAQEMAKIANPEFPVQEMIPDQLVSFVSALVEILSTRQENEAIPKATEAQE